MSAERAVLVTVDFDDEVVLRKRPMTEADIRDALQPLRACGVDGVVWRLTCLGQANYRSAVLAPPAFDADDARFWLEWSRRQPGLKSSLPGTIESAFQRKDWTEWLKATLDRFDPPEAAGRVCRELGLKFLLWYDLFDGWFPGCYDPFLREHPELCWTDRTGTKRLRGVASYAFPENVRRVLRVVEEIDRYRPDGLYLCASCHSMHLPEHPDALQAGGFGFEEPVLRRFRGQQGRDAGGVAADQAELDRVRGEFMTDLFRSVRAALAPAAGLYLPLQMHPSLLKTSPYFDGPVALSYRQDYRTWLDQGLAQGLVVGDYEHIFHWTENWRIKGLPQGDARTIPADFIDALMPALEWNRCAHLLFSGWMAGRAGIAERLRRMAACQLGHPAAGGWIHELANLEVAQAWDVLREYVEQLTIEK